MDSKFPREKTDVLVDGFTNGFDIGYRGPMNRQDSAQNIPLGKMGTNQDLWNKLMKEVNANRFAGPFEEIPYHNFIQSPIGLVPKAGNQTRLIFHLSYNFGELEEHKSLNFHTPQEWCKVKYKDLDHAIKASIKLGKEHSLRLRERWAITKQIGRQVFSTIYYSKSDLKSAFRVVPILARQRCWLIMMAKNPTTGKLAFFSDKCLPFGASISCSRYQLFSDSLKHIIEHITQRHYTVTNYLDDFLFIGTEEAEANRMVRSFINLCDFIGVPVSLDKTEWASTLMIFLGLLLNGVTYTISIPIEKKIKAMNLVDFAMARKKVTIKFIQRMTGTLNFLNRAIVPGRAFTRGMYDKLKTKDKNGKPLKDYHHVNLGTDFLRDCEIWRSFLQHSDSQQLCRPFVDIDGMTVSTTLNFYTDSSLNKNFGLGGIFGNRWIIGRWGRQFVERNNPSIEFLELYALVAGIITWSQEKELQNARITVFCDNESVMHIVNNLTSKCPQCMKLVRLLILDNMKSNRRVFVKHVKSKDNVLADSLSRMDMKRFWKNAPESMNRTPDGINNSIWPVEKVWNGSTDQLLRQIADRKFWI